MSDKIHRGYTFIHLHKEHAVHEWDDRFVTCE